MIRTSCAVILAATMLLVGAGGAHAQLGVSVLAGGYVPGNDFYSLRDAADEQRVGRSSTLGLGVNVDVGPFRLAAAYATGATLSDEGVQNRDDIGDGSVLGAALAYVLRPIPRLVTLQPYALAGIGFTRESFSFDDGTSGIGDTSQNDLAALIGIGADLMLGPVGIVAEITDYITRRDGSFGQHDAFVMIGLKFRM